MKERGFMRSSGVVFSSPAGHEVEIPLLAEGKKMSGGRITKTIWKPNELILWAPNEAHEFVALEDSIFITFVNGIRGGDDFEKDTYRLEVPLHVAKTKK